MENYKNLSGQSGILRYEIGADYITIEFKSGRERFYKYSYVRPGVAHVEHMKALARTGSGLNSYISTTIRSHFDSKW